MTLGRLSVVNAEGELILDRCVRQTATILCVYPMVVPSLSHLMSLFRIRDLNTRFSGLSIEDIDNATQDLETTRSELCTIIDENTIIIGHG